MKGLQTSLGLEAEGGGERRNITVSGMEVGLVRDGAVGRARAAVTLADAPTRHSAIFSEGTLLKCDRGPKKEVQLGCT